MKKAEIFISSKAPGFARNLREILQYRQLLMSFARRDFKVRYAQTYLGFWWSILQPLSALLILFLVFRRVLEVDSQGIPYLPFALSGLLLWNYFSFVISQSASSLLHAQNMIRKIYFPRLCLPLSRSLVGMVEPLIGLIFLGLLLLYYQTGNFWVVLSAPLAILLTALAALGGGIFISALSIRYRDLQQILPLALQLLFFVSPVAYSSDFLKEISGAEYQWLWYINPVTGIIELFRFSLFGTPLSIYPSLSLIVAFLLLILSVRYFQKVERKMADLI